MAAIYRCDLCHRDIPNTADTPGAVRVTVYRSLKVVDLCEARAKPLLDILHKHRVIDDGRAPTLQSKSRSV